MIISFAGHRFIYDKTNVKNMVKEKIKTCVSNEDGIYFYLGGYGDFDNLCATACREVKAEFPRAELVYVTPYLTLNEQKRINEMLKLRLYDSIIYPPIEKTPPKYAISKRNEWMMKNSDIVIAYVKKSYGGAYNSISIAKRSGKKVINLYEE